MPDLDLRQIRYFLAVARERNFTRAAQRLAMTQPALSRAIRSLERAVGTELFVRKPSSVELTDVGRVLAAEVADLDERAANALHKAQRAARITPRPLRLAVRGCDGPLAGRLVGECRARMPGQPVELVLIDPLEQPAVVRSGACELTLVRTPFDSRELDSEVWWTEPRVALVAARHPLAARGEVELAELADDPVVIGPVSSEAERDHWVGADLTPRPWQEGPAVRDSLEILAAVQLGQAIAFVPRSMLPAHLAGDGIALLRVRDLSPSSLALAWRDSSTSPALARFVRLAHEVADSVARQVCPAEKPKQLACGGTAETVSTVRGAGA